MSNGRVLITGGTGGIGIHVAEALARRGMEVVVTGRDATRGRAAVADLRKRTGCDAINLLVSDASDVRACRSLAREVGAVDVLVANAGGIWATRGETHAGIERTLAANFVAPIALTRALLPALRQSAAPRVVHVVSSALEWWRGPDAFADVESRERYVGFDALARAKLLDLWALRALAREPGAETVTMTAVNPGSAWTPGVAALTREAVPQWRWVWPLARLVQRLGKPEKAAASVVAHVASPPVRSGLYFDEGRERALPARLAGADQERRALALADALAERVEGAS